MGISAARPLQESLAIALHHFPGDPFFSSPDNRCQFENSLGSCFGTSPLKSLLSQAQLPIVSGGLLLIAITPLKHPGSPYISIEYS